MRYGISLTAVFLTFCYAFRLGRVFQRNVMDFVPAVQMTKHLQSADLAALVVGCKKWGLTQRIFICTCAPFFYLTTSSELNFVHRLFRPSRLVRVRFFCRRADVRGGPRVLLKSLFNSPNFQSQL